MKSTPLPAIPLLITLAGTILLGSAGFIWLKPEPALSQMELPAIQSTEADMPVTIIQFHSPEMASASTTGILAASPFASDRSAYSRARSAAARQAPPKPVYNPQFVGTSGKGDSIRALIIWMPGEQARSTAIGDDTPWGTLASASSSELHFEGEDGPKTLSMF